MGRYTIGDRQVDSDASQHSWQSPRLYWGERQWLHRTTDGKWWLEHPPAGQREAWAEWMTLHQAIAWLHEHGFDVVALVVRPSGVLDAPRALDCWVSVGNLEGFVSMVPRLSGQGYGPAGDSVDCWVERGPLRDLAPEKLSEVAAVAAEACESYVW